MPDSWRLFTPSTHLPGGTTRIGHARYVESIRAALMQRLCRRAQLALGIEQDAAQCMQVGRDAMAISEFRYQRPQRLRLQRITMRQYAGTAAFATLGQGYRDHAQSGCLVCVQLRGAIHGIGCREVFEQVAGRWCGGGQC